MVHIYMHERQSGGSLGAALCLSIWSSACVPPTRKFKTLPDLTRLSSQFEFPTHPCRVLLGVGVKTRLPPDATPSLDSLLSTSLRGVLNVSSNNIHGRLEKK